MRVGPERRWVEWLVGCRGWVALVGPIFVVNGTIVTKKIVCNRPVLEPRTSSETAPPRGAQLAARRPLLPSHASLTSRRRDEPEAKC